MVKRVITLLGMLLLFSTRQLAAQGQSEEMIQPVDVYLRSAKIALATNPSEYDRALRNLHTARDHYPDNFNVHFLLGSIWADKDEIDSMVAEYGLARKYAPEREWKKIGKNLEKIVDSKWTERFNHAVSLVNQSDSIEALVDTTKSATYSDSVTKVSNEVRAMAKNTLRQCALLKPGDFHAYATRGLIYQRQGNSDSSLADFVVAESLFHRIEMRDSTTNWSDTSVFFSGPNGNPTPAFAEYVKKFKNLTAEKSTRYHNLMASLAAAYYEKQMWPQCIGINRRLHGLDPSEINIIVTMADIFSRLGREDEAYKWQEVVVSRDPGSKDTWYNMGIFYYNTAVRLQDSIIKYEHDLEKTPNNAELQEQLNTYTDKRRDNFEKAVPRFAKVVEIDPKDQDSWRLLAVSRYSLEKWDDAFPALEKAVAFYPDDRTLCHMMKVLLAQTGKTDQLKAWSAKCP